MCCICNKHCCILDFAAFGRGLLWMWFDSLDFRITWIKSIIIQNIQKCFVRKIYKNVFKKLLDYKLI